MTKVNKRIKNNEKLRNTEAKLSYLTNYTIQILSYWERKVFFTVCALSYPQTVRGKTQGEYIVIKNLSQGTYLFFSADSFWTEQCDDNKENGLCLIT